jgi:Beta/Gamma crystallin
VAGEATRSAGDITQIVVFDNEGFLGDHAHMLGTIKDLGKWGNSISSMIILSGTWEFFVRAGLLVTFSSFGAGWSIGRVLNPLETHDNDRN